MGMPQKNNIREENDFRRARWAPITGGAKEDNHKKYDGGIEESYQGRHADPTFIRRSTEVALENALELLAPELGKRVMSEQKLEIISEAIDSSNIAVINKFSLGIVMRTVPELIANSLVSIQMQEGPTAQVYYLDYSYGTAKAPTAAGTRLDLVANRNESYAGGRIYDEVGTGDGAQVLFNAANAETLSRQVFFDGVPQVPTGIVVGAGTGPSGVDQFTFAVAPAPGVEVIVSYTGYAEGNTPRDIDLELTAKTVTAENYALRMGFTAQAMQDLRSQYALDLNAELTRATSAELFAEVDANIVRELYSFAGAGNVNFNSTGYLAGDTSTADRKAYDATLYDRINDAANLIWKIKHGRPNFIVGGTDAIKRLENLEHFSVTNTSTNTLDVRNRVNVGTLGGFAYTVFKDPRMPDNKLLVGSKGSNMFDSGYIYSPYVMAWDTGVLPDPSANFKMKRGLLHRAGKCRVDMNNYATVTIS